MTSKAASQHNSKAGTHEGERCGDPDDLLLVPADELLHLEVPHGLLLLQVGRCLLSSSSGRRFRVHPTVNLAHLCAVLVVVVRLNFERRSFGQSKD